MLASGFRIQVSNLLFYLLILFFPTQLSYHFWPDFSFVSGFRVDYLSPTLYLTDMLIFLLFVSWLFSCHAEFISTSRKILKQVQNDSFKLTFGYWWLLTLLALLIVGILLSKNPLAGGYGLLKLLEFIFLGFYTAFNIRKLNFAIVLVLFSISIIFESFLAILQFVNQSSIGGMFYFFGERTFNGQTPGIANASLGGEMVLRSYATFPHPNVLAGYLTIAMAMVISNIKYQISKITKVFLLVLLALGTITLLLTMSRVAIVLWLAIMLFWYFKKVFSLRHSGNQAKLEHPESLRLRDVARRFWTSQNDGNNLRFSILLLLLLAGSVFFLSPLNSRFINIKLTDESILVREKLMNISFMMIKENPFLGVGLNNFLIELPKYHRISNYFTDLQPVHNIFFLVAAEAGTLGLGFFVWFIGKTYQKLKTQSSKLKATSQNLKLQKKDNLIINPLTLIIILSAILILGLFDHYFLTLQQGQLLFSFILGLCWADMKI